MWTSRTSAVPSGKRIELLGADRPLSYRAVFDSLANNSDFRRWYTRLLAHCDYDAFFWEHPPLTVDALDGNAEFVLIESAALAGLNPDAVPFKRHFAQAPDDLVLTFPNLGGDALLIVPTPVGPTACYPHLAAFIRNAPDEQVHSLWQAAAHAVDGHLADTPRWLSTAGLGVSWLHLRLDTRPKYYRHGPYKSTSGE